MKHHTKKIYREVEVQLHTFITCLMEVSGQLQAPAAVAHGINTQYSLNRRLSGPQSWSGHNGEEKNLCPYQELNPSSNSLESEKHL
jgi:hypothetical protein